MKYARLLLKHIPKETTRFFVEYYTGRFIPRKQPRESKASKAAPADTGPGGLAQYTAFLPQLPYRAAAFPVQAAAPAVPVGASALPGSVGSQTDESEMPKYIPPQPRTAFSSFVENPREFIEFLESLLEMESELKQLDKIDIYTTLFEMYLRRAKGAAEVAEKEKWEAKAKKIIQSKENLIDTSNILLLSHLSNFSDGTVLVREKQGLRFDIFRSCTSAGDTKGALEALQKYGPEEPQLYTAALAYFTSSAKVLNEVGEEELKNVLNKIDELGLMKPLQVVQTLSVNAVATVGMVKKYLGETIQKERKEIQAVGCHRYRRVLKQLANYLTPESAAHRKLQERYRVETEGNRRSSLEARYIPGTEVPGM